MGKGVPGHRVPSVLCECFREQAISSAVIQMADTGGRVFECVQYGMGIRERPGAQVIRVKFFIFLVVDQFSEAFLWPIANLTRKAKATGLTLGNL